FASRCARDNTTTWCERLKGGLQIAYRFSLASNHQAIAAFETPHTTARADINVENSFGLEFLGAPDIVDIVGIASIHDDVALLHLRLETVDSVIDDGCGHHQPNCAWRLQCANQIFQRGGSDGTLLGQLLHTFLCSVKHNAFVATADETTHHVRAHPAQADHSNLHFEILPSITLRCSIVNDLADFANTQAFHVSFAGISSSQINFGEN